MKKFYTLLMLAILSIGCNLGFSRGVNVHATTCAEEEDTTVYTVADVQPEFQGNLFQYLGANIQYPRKAYEKGIAGNVVVSFVISKTGEIVNAKIIRSVHPLLDKEALRVVESMPRWKPGTIKGVPVNIKYSLPISFRLPTPTSEKK